MSDRVIKGLTAADRQQWEKDNINSLKEEGYFGWTTAEKKQRFLNSKFKETFGELEEYSQLRTLDYNQRNQLLADQLFSSRYAPTETSKGIEDYEYYNRMGTDFKLKALEEGLKTNQEIDAEYAKLNKEIKDIKDSTPSWLQALADNSSPLRVTDNLDRTNEVAYSEEFIDSQKANNKAKLEDLYGEWLRVEQDRLSPIVEATFNDEVSKLSDQEVKEEFNAIIEPIDGVQLGIPEYGAYKNSKWMKEFSPDQMREVISKYKAYQKAGMPPKDIMTALDNEAKDYIKEQQDFFDTVALGANDIVTTGIAYTGQKLAGLEAAALGTYSEVTGDDAKVYVLKDGSGTIVSEKDIAEGKFSRDQVMETSINRGSLFMRGYNADGTKNDSWLNPQYLEKATMYGTLDDEEIAEADKYGRSVHKPEWGSKQQTNVAYDTFKMMGYTTADVLTEILPAGLGKVNKAINGVNKMAKIAKKTLDVAENVARYTNMGASAIGNAFANATGDYGATLQENLYNLEQTQRNLSNEEANTWATNNIEEYNSRITEEYNRLVEGLLKDNPDLDASTINEEALRKMASKNVLDAKSEELFELAKTTDRYNQAVEEAYANASSAAYNTLITNSIKGAMDNVGYRRFLFMDKSKMAREAAENAVSGVVSREGRLVLDNLTRADKVRKFGKHLGKQMIGGFADEYGENLLMGGSRAVSSGLFNQYLESYKNGEALESISTIGNTLLQAMSGSFMEGAMSTAMSEEALYEGLIGGLGANLPTVNLHNIMNYKAIKEQWAKEGHNPSLLEQVNNFITNGTLSEYYAELQGHRQLQQQVDIANKFLDETNWEDIKNVAASDIMMGEATGPRDLNTAQFMKALNVVQALQSSGNDEMDAILGKSDKYSEAKALWEAAVNDELTEEQTDNLLREYYSKNPSIPKSEENDAKALEQIKDNSKRLIEADNNLTATRELIDRVEQTTGKKMDEDTKKYAIFRSIMSGEFAKRAGKMEEEVSGNKSNTSEVSSLLNLASYGTNVSSLSNALLDKGDSLKGEIESAKAKLETLEEGTTEYNETRQELTRLEVESENNEALINELSIAQQEVVDEYDSANPNNELSTKDKVNKSMTTEAVFGFKVDVYNPEHIDRAEKFVRNLNPKVRARVMSSIAMSRADKSAAPVFEGEIGKVLNKVYDRILTTDPEALQKIQDIPILQEQRTLVESELTEAINNPELAAQKLATQHTKELQAASTVFNHKAAEKIEGHTMVIEQVARDSGMSDEDVQTTLFHHLKQYKPSYLQSIKERNRDIARKYGDVLDRAIKMQELIGDIVTYSRTTAITPEQKEAFSKEVAKVLDNPNVKSKEDALKAFSDLAEDSNLDDATRDFYARLSDELEAIELQRNSTETLTDEVKKERKKRREQAKKDYKDRLESERQKAIQEQLDREAKEQEEEDTKAAKAKEAYEESIIGTAEEEAKTDVTPEVAKTESNTEDIDLESPTMDKQVEESKDKAKVVPATAPKVDNRPREMQSDTELIGNAMYRYLIDSLTEDGYIVPRKGLEDNDKMSKFFNWMDAAGLNFQEVIDKELSDILKVNPVVNFLMVKPNRNATNDIDMQDHVLEVIEYTPEVARIHKSIDGTLEANGKRWLVIGALGFNGGIQGVEYRRVKDLQLKVARKKYFDSNPTERFYVDPTHSTRVSSITTGYIARKLANDSEVQIRNVSELLADSSRNPEGLTMEDLAWGLAQDSKFVVIGVNEDNVLAPNDLSGNSGNVFIMTKAADGRYIPLAIKPTMYSEIKEGKLKSNIDTLLNELTSPVYSERRAAINTLVQLLHLSSTGKNILIGKEDRNTLSISDNGVITSTFDLNSPDFNRQDFLDAVTKLNPRINITVSSLSNPTELGILDEAGALTTDAASLGTFGASFRVYNVDTQGQPIIVQAIETNSQRASSSDYNRSKTPSTIFNGQTFRLKNGRWVTATDKPVDEETRKQLENNYLIDSNNMSPILTRGDFSFYVINQDRDNPQIIKRNNKTRFTTMMDSDGANSVLQEVNREKEREAKKQAAKNYVEVNLNDDAPVESDEVTPSKDNLVQGSEEEFALEDKKKEEKVEPKSEDTPKVDSTEGKSLSQLQDRSGATTYEEIATHPEYQDRLDSIIDEKIDSGAWEDFPDEVADISAYLNSKGIATEGITDIESWLEMIEKCK